MIRCISGISTTTLPARTRTQATHCQDKENEDDCDEYVKSHKTLVRSDPQDVLEKQIVEHRAAKVLLPISIDLMLKVIAEKAHTILNHAQGAAAFGCRSHKQTAAEGSRSLISDLTDLNPTRLSHKSSCVLDPMSFHFPHQCTARVLILNRDTKRFLLRRASPMILA